MSALSDIAFHAVLERVEAGTTTSDDARWLHMYVRELQAECERRHNAQYGDPVQRQIVASDSAGARCAGQRRG